MNKSEREEFRKRLVESIDATAPGTKERFEAVSQMMEFERTYIDPAYLTPVDNKEQKKRLDAERRRECWEVIKDVLHILGNGVKILGTGFLVLLAIKKEYDGQPFYGILKELFSFALRKA